MSDKKPEIVISLSGGGDRTFVLAGIIHYLKTKYNIKLIVTVSGSSYTVPIAMASESITASLSRINRFDLLSFAKLNSSDEIIKKRGLFDINPEMYRYIEVLTGVTKGISSNPIYLPTAVDISKEDIPVKYLGNMRFGMAVRASMAFPFLITPLYYRNSILVDGGLKGDYHTKPLGKYKNIPKVVLNLADHIDYGSLLTSIKYVFKQLNVPIFRLADLRKLYKEDEVLRKVSQHIPKHFTKNVNFIFNIHGLSKYNLLLPSTDKQKLFLKGYFLGEYISSKLDYALKFDTWKQYSSENEYNISLKDSVLNKIISKKDAIYADTKDKR